jgi:hypothetical protein
MPRPRLITSPDRKSPVQRRFVPTLFDIGGYLQSLNDSHVSSCFIRTKSPRIYPPKLKNAWDSLYLIGLCEPIFFEEDAIAYAQYFLRVVAGRRIGQEL